MLHGFKGDIFANMTQVSDVAPGPLVYKKIYNLKTTSRGDTKPTGKSSLTLKIGQGQKSRSLHFA
jgi:hypothetical protein